MDFDTYVIRIWGLHIYFLNKFLAKILRWGISGEMAILHQSRAGSCDCHMWSISDFENHCHVVDSRIWPKNATFNDLFMTQVLNPPLGSGEDGLGRQLVPPPPPHQGILLFCLILLNHMTSGVFSGCQLSLSKQHIFLILMQPSWGGYICGTILHLWKKIVLIILAIFINF